MQRRYRCATLERGRIDQKRPISHWDAAQAHPSYSDVQFVCLYVLLKCNLCDLEFEVLQSEDAQVIRT